jgi:biotin carboxylase
VPRHIRVTSPAALREAAAELGYPQRPFVVKPATARGGRGVWVIREGGASMQELLQGIAIDAVGLDGYIRAAETAGSMPALLAMEYLAGDVFDVDILGAGGRLKIAVARRRFHPRTTPFRGCTLERHAAVLELTRAVHRALALDYLQDVDIIAGNDGSVHLLEVNPRQSASVITTVAAGCNLLEDLVRVALGLEVAARRVPYGRAILPSIRTTSLPRQ